MEFKQYKRKAIAEMRDLDEWETSEHLIDIGISVSEVDQALEDAVFKQGKIARNLNNHSDQWYVAKEYFDSNFEEI